MNEQTLSILLETNRVFYRRFGRAFAATRRRIQPGVQQILRQLPDWCCCQANGCWLDLGCGSGALAAIWSQRGECGEYVGMDFSPQLLEEARTTLAEMNQPDALSSPVSFLQGDLSEPDWAAVLEGRQFDGLLAFAVLHHIPGKELRLRILRKARELLVSGGCFIHSEWQFQHSPRLMERRQLWEKIGLSAEDVEAGDTLLDWRHFLPGEIEEIGLRYVHLFNQAELAELAGQSGFEIVQEFHSDGSGGKLGLYQIWRAN
jgi:tRNA (uracil-5-)-methyltransferase TRM9